MRYRIITAPRTRGTHALDCLIIANNPDQKNINSDLYNEPYNHSIPNSAVDWMIGDKNAVVKHHIRHLVANDVYYSAEPFARECSVEWNTILLLRRNLFDQSISYARSRLLNQWASYTNDTVEIEPQLFVDSVLALWGSVVHASRNAKRLTYNKVVWSEDLTGNNILDTTTLGIDIPVDAHETTTRSPTNTIANIEQLREVARQIQLPQHRDTHCECNNNLIITSFNWNK